MGRNEERGRENSNTWPYKVEGCFFPHLLAAVRSLPSARLSLTGERARGSPSPRQREKEDVSPFSLRGKRGALSEARRKGEHPLTESHPRGKRRADSSRSRFGSLHKSVKKRAPSSRARNAPHSSPPPAVLSGVAAAPGGAAHARSRLRCLEWGGRASWALSRPLALR